MLAEMIPVILPLQMRTGCFVRLAVRPSHPLDVRTKLVQQLPLGDAAYRAEVIPHTDVLQIIQLAEDAHLAELADSRDKEETKILPQSLEGTEKLTQLIPKLLLQGDVGIAVQKRSIVFVNQDNDRQTGLFIRTADHTLQTGGRSLFLLFRPINLFTTK